MKHIKIESSLANITNDVFNAKDFKTAQQIALAHLEECKIKESDKQKMIEDINKLRNLEQLQFYCANSLLKYEGLGTGNKLTEDK